MSKKKDRKNGNGKAAVEMPEGFGINVGRERGEGWAKKEDGNEVMGRLLGRFTYELRGKKRGYYQIKLLKPCKVEIEDPEGVEDDEGNIPRLDVVLEPGAIVNVDETAKLLDLEPFTKNGGTYDLWFVYGPKIDIDGGQTMWSFAGGPRLRPVAKPSETPDQQPF